MKPMYNLLMKNTSWSWSSECQESLDAVKEQLSTSPVLVHYDSSKLITVASDESLYEVGSVLSHIIDNGDGHPI